MRIVRNAAGMQRLALEWKRAGVRVGFVPTMGYLHEGHMSLVRRVRRKVGRAGRVVVSIYVNPAQFGPQEDFSKYPRDLARDTKLCGEAGVDVLFTPADLYERDPLAAHSTYVEEEELSRTMEGASRPAHFRGVTTVVAKLFNLVLPDVAVFGAKDYQQAAVIQRMARDLNFPLKIDVAPTRRERDGLALSSRNKYLEGDLRAQGTILWRAIRRAQAVVANSRKPIPAKALRAELAACIREAPAARVDYIAFFDPANLRASETVSRGTQMALAVFVGTTRLIDNAQL